MTRASGSCGRTADAFSIGPRAFALGQTAGRADYGAGRGPPFARRPRSPRPEYELKDELDGAWAVRPLELVRDRGRTMLVLEDPGGEPLAGLLGAPMEVGSFLRLAVGIAGGPRQGCTSAASSIRTSSLPISW